LLHRWIRQLLGDPSQGGRRPVRRGDDDELWADDHSLLTEAAAVVAASPGQVAPSADDLEAIQPDDVVELCADKHSFWVRIIGRDQHHLIGEFDTLPFPSMANPPFRAFYGTRIRFRPCHVCRIRPPMRPKGADRARKTRS